MQERNKIKYILWCPPRKYTYYVGYSKTQLCNTLLTDAETSDTLQCGFHGVQVSRNLEDSMCMKRPTVPTTLSCLGMSSLYLQLQLRWNLDLPSLFSNKDRHKRQKANIGTCRSTTCVVNGKIYIRLDSIFHVNDGCFRLIYKSSSATAFTCIRAQSLGFWEFANLLKIWDDEHHCILLRQYIKTKLLFLTFCYLWLN